MKPTPHNNTEKIPAGPDAATMLANMPHPVMALTRSGDITYVNLAAEEFFSSGRAILTGCRLQDIIPFGSPLLALIEQVFRHGHCVNEYGITLGMPKHQGRQPVDIQLSPIASLSPDAPEQVILSIRPHSVALKIDRQLSQRSAVRSVSGMAAMLAHEIKNPLSGIRGAAQLLEADIADENLALTRLICSETDRIAGLVDQFEIFTDRPHKNPEEINIHTILQHVVRLAQTGFAKNIRVIEDYDPSLPTLYGYKDQLIQLFLNLIKNAAEAVDKKNGEITLKTSFRPGVYLTSANGRKRRSLPMEFSVRDNGHGVDEDLRRIIFEPFITGKSGGTGLGLALAAKIVDEHGGIIECESEPGNTVFRILMPRAERVEDSENAEHAEHIEHIKHGENAGSAESVDQKAKIDNAEGGSK